MDSDGEGSAGSGTQVAPIEGVVVAQLPHALYRVRLDAGGHVTAHIGGRVDRNFLRLLVGDRVRIELTPEDRWRGRIVEKVV